MPSFSTVVKGLVALGPLAIRAAPTEQANVKTFEIEKRQMAGGPSPKLTDVDILQFALTAEHLESTFYNQGFAMFPDSDFTSAGLTQQDVADLKQVGNTEGIHVTALTSAISAAGGQPVQACQYNFGFTNAQGMIATARTLEAVGLSAYLGAAPLVNSSTVLTTAATIATIEARHQAFLRVADQAMPVPVAFDTPLSVRSVFTLLAPFITSCPQGSNLNIQAFPSINVTNGQGITGGDTLVLQNQNAKPNSAQFCGFISQGNATFVAFNQGSCSVPNGIAGEVYMVVTSSQSMADEAILAGPSVLSPS